MPWLAGIAWVCHGSPACPPTTCLLASDSGGPPSRPRKVQLPPFLRATVEPVALWLEMMIKDGKLVWMRRGLWEGRASWSPGSRTGEPGSRDRAEPASPAQLSAKWIGKAVLVGEDTSQEAGASRAAVGAVDPAAMRRKGAGPIQVKGQGEHPAPTLWESLWDTHWPGPTALWG